MTRFRSIKTIFLLSCLLASACLTPVYAQEVRQLPQAEVSALLDRIFQQGILCPDGFSPNGAYPKTARCISFRNYGNCPAIASGCVEQEMKLQKPASKLFKGEPSSVKYCNCPPSFDNQ